MTQWLGELSEIVSSRTESVTWWLPSKSTKQEWLIDLVSSQELYWAGLTQWLSVIVTGRNDWMTWSAFSNSTRQEWLSDLISSQSQRWAGMTRTLQSLPNGMVDRSSVPRTLNDFSKISILWDVTSRWWLNAFCHLRRNMLHPTWSDHRPWIFESSRPTSQWRNVTSQKIPIFVKIQGY